MYNGDTHVGEEWRKLSVRAGVGVGIDGASVGAGVGAGV